jgi:hypothetical protein
VASRATEILGTRRAKTTKQTAGDIGGIRCPRSRCRTPTLPPTRRNSPARPLEAIHVVSSLWNGLELALNRRVGNQQATAILVPASPVVRTCSPVKANEGEETRHEERLAYLLGRRTSRILDGRKGTVRADLFAFCRICLCCVVMLDSSARLD